MIATTNVWVGFAVGVEVGACVGLFVSGLLNAAAARRWKREHDE